MKFYSMEKLREQAFERSLQHLNRSVKPEISRISPSFTKQSKKRIFYSYKREF